MDSSGVVDREVAERLANMGLPPPESLGHGEAGPSDGFIYTYGDGQLVPPMGSDGRPLSMVLLPGGARCRRDGDVVMVIPAGAFALRWGSGGEQGEHAAEARRRGLDGREGVEWVLLGERVSVRRGLEGKVPVTAQHMLRPSGEVLEPVIPEDVQAHAMRAADEARAAGGAGGALEGAEEASAGEARALAAAEWETGVAAEDDAGIAQLLAEARAREARGEPQSLPREDLVPEQASAFSGVADNPRLPSLHRLWNAAARGREEALSPAHQQMLAHARQVQLWAAARELRVRPERAELLFGGRLFGREFARAVVEAHHARWRHFLQVGQQQDGRRPLTAGYAAMGSHGAERPWRPEAGWEAPRSSAAPDREVGRVPRGKSWRHFTRRARDAPLDGWQRRRYERVLVERREEYMRREERPVGEY